MNYIYGTWSVLAGLASIGEDMRQPYVRRAVAWLKGHQNPRRRLGRVLRVLPQPGTDGPGAEHRLPDRLGRVWG